MGSALRGWRSGVVVFPLLVLSGSVALAQKPLSQVVAEGIGKRFPATAADVSYDRWPLPLRESPGAMMTAAITAEGSLVATGCGHPNQPGELVLWDVATGRERWVRRYPRGVRWVAFTSEGSRLATGSFDGVARLLDTASGKLLRELRGHTDAINAIALSSDDRFLVTGSHDKTVMVWDLSGSAEPRTLRAHTEAVLTVAVSKDGKLLASAGRDRIVRIWKLDTGQTLHTLIGHEDLIEMVAFAPDDATLASASWDGTVRIWDCETGAPRASLRRNARVTSLAFSPDGKEVWCGGFDGQLAVWDGTSNAAARELKVQNGATYAVSLSGDGQRIVTCGFEGTARLWKPDGTLLQKFDRQLLPDDARRIEQAAWSPNGESAATVHGDGMLRLTRVSDGVAEGELHLGGERIMFALFAGDGKTLYVASSSGAVCRWDPAAKAEARKLLTTHAGPVTAMALSSDGGRLVSCAQDGSIEIRSTDGSSVARAKADSPATCAAIDGVGGRVVTGHTDGRVRFWKLDTGHEITSEVRLAMPVRALTLAPVDGALAVAAGSSVEILELTYREDSAKVTRRRVLTVPEGAVTQLAFAPFGQQLLSGDTTGEVRLWATPGGGARTLGRKHAGGVTALAIAPTIATLLTCGEDLNAWLWRPVAADGAIRPLASIPAHEKGTRYVALAKMDRLISDGYDNHVRVWNLATGREERDLGVPDSASSCVLLGGGTRVAVGHWSKRVQLVELETGQRLDNIRGLPRGPYAIAMSPAEDRLAAVFRELGAMVYDLTADEADPAVTLPPDDLPFTHVVFSPDGNTFVTCTGDYQRMDQAGKVRLHDAKTGKVMRSFVGHSSEVKMSAFDADGQRLITVGGDKTARIWDVATGRMLSLLPHPIGTFAPAFVPQSDLVLTADYHGKVYLWDLRKTSPVQVIAGHADLVNRMDVSEDQTLLATGSRDGTVKLWKLSGHGNELRIVNP